MGVYGIQGPSFGKTKSKGPFVARLCGFVGSYSIFYILPHSLGVRNKHVLYSLDLFTQKYFFLPLEREKMKGVQDSNDKNKEWLKYVS